MIDVNTLIGPYPFRFVPHPDADVLARVLERERLDGAWVGHLPSVFYRDPGAANAPAVRAYPAQWQLAPHDGRLAELAIACGAARMAVMLTVRFEDLRQRHPLDVAGDLQPAAVRALARAGDAVRLIVTAAGREFIEEVHWGLTPEEQRRGVW